MATLKEYPGKEGAVLGLTCPRKMRMASRSTSVGAQNMAVFTSTSKSGEKVCIVTHPNRKHTT
jgi:hypothetical protein